MLNTQILFIFTHFTMSEHKKQQRFEAQRIDGRAED